MLINLSLYFTVPFCRIKESMGAPSSLVAIHSANETSFDISNMQIASNQIQPTPISMEHEYTEDLSKLIEVPEVIHNNSENTESTTDVYLFESPELNLNLIEEGVDGLREEDSMGKHSLVFLYLQVCYVIFTLPRDVHFL